MHEDSVLLGPWLSSQFLDSCHGQNSSCYIVEQHEMHCISQCLYRFSVLSYFRLVLCQFCVLVIFSLSRYCSVFLSLVQYIFLYWLLITVTNNMSENSYQKVVFLLVFFIGKLSRQLHKPEPNTVLRGTFIYLCLVSDPVSINHSCFGYV